MKKNEEKKKEVFEETFKTAPLRIGAIINTAFKPSRDFLVGVERSIEAKSKQPNTRKMDLKFFLGSAATKLENLSTFVDSGLDVIVSCGMDKALMFKFLEDRPDHPPVVFATFSKLTDKDWKKLGDGAVVMFDDESIGKSVADFYIGHGLRNFAFLSRKGYREDISASVRKAAFKARIDEVVGVNVSYSELSIGEFSPKSEDSWESDQAETGKWVESLPHPCGVFVNGEHLAYRLLQGCIRHGIDVPDSLEILGVNSNDGFCGQAVPAISCVVPNLDQFAYKTIEVACDLANAPEIRRQRRFEVVSAFHMMERGTTSLGRGYGHVALRAKEYIRAHACKGISVLDVAHGLGVSRRTLEIRVREAVGKSVHMLIREEKMGEICNLLKNTNMPISEIVTRAGYSLTTNAFVLFKRTFGMTMREYRRAHRGV